MQKKAGMHFEFGDALRKVAAPLKSSRFQHFGSVKGF